MTTRKLQTKRALLMGALVLLIGSAAPVYASAGAGAALTVTTVGLVVLAAFGLLLATVNRRRSAGR